MASPEFMRVQKIIHMFPQMLANQLRHVPRKHHLKASSETFTPSHFPYLDRVRSRIDNVRSRLLEISPRQHGGRSISEQAPRCR